MSRKPAINRKPKPKHEKSYWPFHTSQLYDKINRNQSALIAISHDMYAHAAVTCHEVQVM